MKHCTALSPRFFVFLLTLIAAGLPAAALALPGAGEAAPGDSIALTPENFQSELSRLRAADGSFPAGSHFYFAPGDYTLIPRPYVDPSCGNCEDPATSVEATLGLRVAGKGIVLEGPGEGEEAAVIHTNAGYGLLFQDCEDCVLENLRVTDGVRDPDPNATDAGVVVQRSSLRIQNCDITENIGDSTLLAENIVGIIGIAGREGAHLTVYKCSITRNSWDGIALYRGADARIERNLIDGVDRAGATVPGGGRGVGVGVTWDAKAQILENKIRRYWKGVGVFVDAQAVVRKNYIQELSTWGVALWDAGKGHPSARIEGNIIWDTGACGVAVTLPDDGEGPDPGHLSYNIIAHTGQNTKYDGADSYCTQCPVAMMAARPKKFEVIGNMLYDNRRAPEDAGGDYPDMTEEDFRYTAGAIASNLAVDSHLFIKDNYPKPLKHE